MSGFVLEYTTGCKKGCIANTYLPNQSNHLNQPVTGGVVSSKLSGGLRASWQGVVCVRNIDIAFSWSCSHDLTSWQMQQILPTGEGQPGTGSSPEKLALLKQLRLGFSRQYYAMASVLGLKRIQDYFQVSMAATSLTLTFLAGLEGLVAAGQCSVLRNPPGFKSRSMVKLFC